MPQTTIENPILNSPFAEPTAHWRFGEDGITDELVQTRRVSSYFIPIPQPKNRRQLTLETSWTSDRLTENEFINQVRQEVGKWRAGGYTGVTAVTRALLEYWTDPQRDRRLFFCQIEALETTIFLTEVATRTDPWMATKLRDDNEFANVGLPRIAIKMATGSGKTVVMAMLIAWQALNKLSNVKDGRFSDAFLIVAPGITIRDRLRVLEPSATENYYVDRDIVGPDMLTLLQRANVVIINYHSFLLHEKLDAPNFTKEVLAGSDKGAGLFKESPAEMVRRACRKLGTKKNIVVINDEAHHCYRQRPEAEDDAAAPLDVEAKHNAEAARVWLGGLEAVRDKLGIRAVYDLSATPFFLSGSGYKEGTLFPWVVSDFSLIDAIESGIVKIPRVPVSDDQMAGDSPTYRDLWRRIRDDLPKKGRGETALSGSPNLPTELDGALRSLYSHYKKCYALWSEDGHGTPPVFIVICNNTAVSKLVFDWIAGHETAVGSVATGNLELFSNAEHGQWLHRPNTLLIDSAQLESGQAMSDAFKQIASREIAEFKDDYRERFPGRTAESVTDEDVLREVMNTVGKAGKLGEHIKCVVSVSMLTEGWDANTVTHILGVRAFGTQLLCEQVVGRGLRRISYEANENGRFEPEYAEVYGVPFSFIPTASSATKPVVQKQVHRVYAIADRSSLEITFPHIVGYRYKLPEDTLDADFTRTDLHMVLSPEQLPLNTQLDPIAGESVIHSLDELKTRRVQNVAFTLAKYLLETKFVDYEGNERPWLFPKLAVIAKQWLDDCVTCKSGAFVQMLLVSQLGRYAAEKIYQGIVLGTTGEKQLMPIVRSFDPQGSSSNVAFNTTKPVYVTDPEKCHVNYLVADTESWEQKMAEVFEEGLRREVVSYVKNQGLGFSIPYTLAGAAKNYLPDFIVKYDDGKGAEPLNLIVEVTGERRPDKAIKVSTAKNLWVPAVNNDGRFGRWDFVEILDPWDAESLIRSSFHVAVGV